MDCLSERHLNLLSGRLSKDEIPAVKAHVIRVYLCSAGTDSMTERDQFVEHVYPRLREYCRDKFGLEFQIVDLAWGLSPGEIDSQTDLTPLRIREIQKCQSLSAGPNFITFIGQKYGPRALPDVILADEYDIIRLALHGHRGRDTRNAPILDKCYMIDDNNIPPVYVLKDKAVLVPELNDNNEEVRQEGVVKWEELQLELRTLLQKGAELAHIAGALDTETKDRYFVSELENQIILGVETNDIPKRRCVLITRHIDDLKNYLEDSRSQRFAELVYNEREERMELNQDASQMLLKLKNRTMGLLAKENILQHDVLWRYDDVISPKHHREYLDTLNEQLYQACVRLIHESAPPPETANVPRACDEAMQHWSRCKYMASSFHSQEAPLQALVEYVTGDSTVPLIAHGAHGCGKSKIISKLAYEMEDVLNGDYLVLLRYMGYTTSSRDARQLLLSLCSQLTIALGGADDTVPTDMKELLKHFSDMINSLPQSCRLILLLDGLENLTSDHEDHLLSWIPRVLPPNVKVIITVHSTERGLLDQIKEEILPAPECFLEILAITVDECESLLTALLNNMDRAITPIQMKVFRSALEAEPLPLYVELLANIAKDMNSFTDASTLDLPKNCEEGIRMLLERLEKKHGKVLVARAFAYMVASNTGLSDCEMEDILSLDEDVLNEVFVKFHPPVRRIPYIKWLALKQEVEAFLVYRDADGVTVAIWQHDRFVSAVQERYLSDEAVSRQVHSNIADYFLGTWAGRPKPVTVANDKQRLAVASYDSDRRVPIQPHTFGTHEPLRFNKRKYDQVPRHLDLSGRHKELNSLVFFNYEWLYSKIKALSLQHIIADFALNPSEEASLVEEALRVAEPVIERDINSLPSEISGHLMPYYATHANIRSLIRQCDIDGLRHCAVVPNFPYIEVPGSSLQFCLRPHIVCENFLLQKDDKILACKKRDDAYVHSFNLETGDLKESVFTSNGELYSDPEGKYYIVVDHVTEKSIKIHDAQTGAFLKQIILMNHIEGKSHLYKKGPLCITKDRLCAIVTLNNSVLCICEIPSGEVMHVVALDGKASVCAMSPDGQRVFCNSNTFLVAYDVYTLQHLLTVPIGSKPTSLVLTHDGYRAFFSNAVDTRLTIMHLNGTAIEMTYRAVLEERMPHDKIAGLTISPNDALLLVRGLKHLLVYHRGLEKVIATFNKPDDVPTEFRLPKSNYVPMTFSHAQFTHDSNFVIGTIFRHVYVWQVSTNQMVTSIQAPIGLITTMLVSGSRTQVITHLRDSDQIQVWNIDEAMRKVDIPDKLTDAITDIKMTEDNTKAFIRCASSDEIGVIDMSNGAMVDLMTHDKNIEDFAISPKGGWALVSTKPRIKSTAFKLWNMEERKIVLEIGNVSGYCIGTHSAPTLIMVSQKEDKFKAPYYISALHLKSDEFYEHAYTQTITIVRAKPFVTADDQFLVMNSAADFGDGPGVYSSPCVCTFNINNGMQMAQYDGASLNFEDHLSDILEVRPVYDKRNHSLIAAVFSCKDHYEEAEDNFANDNQSVNRSVASPGCPYGFFLLDASKGSMTHLCIPFPRPSYGVGSYPLIFSKDCTFCLDAHSNVFHIPTGEFVGQVLAPTIPPRAFTLKGTAVLYYSGSLLHVVRMSDGVSLAQCEVHAPICYIHVCSDEHTVLVGCKDGAVMSYTIIDPTRDNPTLVLSKVGSRRVGNPEMFDRSSSRRSWDKGELDGCPSYSRSPSAISPGPRDKILLKQVKAIPRPRPKSDSLALSGSKSTVCCVM